jgi:hypothetical protein
MEAGLEDAQSNDTMGELLEQPLDVEVVAVGALRWNLRVSETTSVTLR